MKNIATQLAAAAMVIAAPAQAQDNTSDQTTSKAETLSDSKWIVEMQQKSARRIEEEHSLGMAAAAVAMAPTDNNYKVSCESDGGSMDISVKNGETKISTTDVFGRQNYETTRAVFKSSVEAINSAKAQCDIGLFSHAAQSKGLEFAVSASSALIRHSPDTSNVKVKFEIK